MDWPALAGTAGALAAGAGGMAWAVRGKSASILAPSVWHGDRTRPVIYWTFDDGPSESTEELLEVLEKERVNATFFQCGANAERLPEIARAVSRGGHEIGNHTWSHPMLYGKSKGYIREEVIRAQKLLESLHGAPPRLFRAPYGVRWFGLGNVQKELGLMGVMWTTIGRDWRLQGQEVAARLVQGASNGAIFCLHDGRELGVRPDIRPTIHAVRESVPKLRDMGFRFGAVSEIL